MNKCSDLITTCIMVKMYTGRQFRIRRDDARKRRYSRRTLATETRGENPVCYVSLISVFWVNGSLDTVDTGVPVEVASEVSGRLKSSHTCTSEKNMRICGIHETYFNGTGISLRAQGE